MSSQTLKDLCDGVNSIYVSKSGDLKQEDIEKLPNDKLKESWNNGDFEKFLGEFQCIMPAVASQESNYEIIVTLPFLRKLGHLSNPNVHSAIFVCYNKLIELCSRHDVSPAAAELQTSLRKSLARSISRYVDSILCSERKILCPDIRPLQNFLVSEKCEEQTFKVEKELCREFRKQEKKSDLPDSRSSGRTCVLQRIALQFLKKLHIYPLKCEFPNKPGVYFIYHVGKTQLYEGSQYFPSRRKPVYVGMSTRSIGNRLRTHRRRITRASADKQTEASGQTDKEQTEGEEETEDKEKSDEEQSDEEQSDEEQSDEEQADEKQSDEEQSDEEQSDEEQTDEKQTEGVKMELTDFFVRFMIVDSEYYACSIEGMLIDYFRPVWNDKKVKLCFGNAGKRSNTWHKYHITKDADTITEVLHRLKNQS